VNNRPRNIFLGENEFCTGASLIIDGGYMAVEMPQTESVPKW